MTAPNSPHRNRIASTIAQVEEVPGRCANSPGRGQHLLRRSRRDRRYIFAASLRSCVMGGPGSGQRPVAFPPEVIEEIAQRRARGESNGAIREAMGISRWLLDRLIRENSIAQQPRTMQRVADGPVDCSQLATNPPVVIDDAGCWLWQGFLYPGGYGYVERTRSQGLSSTFAHRVMYELHVGPIPKGLQLDHLCRVRQCVNPTHLEPVTHAENIRRGAAARRAERGTRG